VFFQYHPDRYDGRADIWSVGITAIEMAEMLPPNSDVHPMRILFLIPQDPPPKLINQKGWSPAFHEFLAAALQKDPKLRPDARAMLGYKFVSKCKTNAIIKDLVRQKEDAKVLQFVFLRLGFSQLVFV
jgi:serine/threonine protein kinase